jgi:hypothetical protein
MSSFDFITWAPIIGTWVLVIGTLAFAYWQLTQAQRLHSATTLLDLRERFFNPRMRMARRELATWLLAKDRGEEIENWEVGIFFELMGSLTRSGVLDRRMVWSAFGTWITAYYVFTVEPVDLIKRWRDDADDPLIFAEFEWLAKQVREFDSRMAPSVKRAHTALEDSRVVLEGESRLDVSGDEGFGGRVTLPKAG